MNLNNCVIEALTKEHGAKIVEFFKKNGYQTNGYTGSVSKENGEGCRYYGGCCGYFANFSINEIKEKNLKIITLPEESEYPKVMMVSDDKINWYQRVVFMDKTVNNHKYYLAWESAETLEQTQKEIYTSVWKYAKDIEEPKVEEMTLEQVCKELGREIKIVK